MPITPPNSGPRSKQIQNLKNDETVPAAGSLLGVNAAGKTDWLDVKIQDLVIPSTTGGRLTSGGSVPADPVYGGDSFSSALWSLWFVPYIHDLIALYDGTKWNYHKIIGKNAPGGELGIFNDGTDAATVNAGNLANAEIADVYVYDDDGALSIELHKWATHGVGTSARAASFGIVRQNGVWVSENDNTRRFVGTVKNGSTLFTQPGMHINARVVGVWNVQNQVLVRMGTVGSDGAGDGTMTFGSFQHWSHPNDPTGSTNNDFPVEIVVGLPTSVRCSFVLRTTSFIVSLPISQSIPDFETRVASSVELNNNTANAVGPPSIANYGTSISAAGDTSTTIQFQKTSRSDIFPIGANEFQPIWVAPVWPEPFDPIGTQETQNQLSYNYEIEYLR